MRRSMVSSLALAVIVTGSVWAHHSMSAFFDLRERFIQTGTLTELDWRNPHVHLSVDVKSDEDRVETWRFEGPPPISFRNGDIGRSGFEDSIGKTVTVDASPARDGSLSGVIRQITLADGTVLSLCPDEC